jgi:purine-binding chemotaxis protein CheW
MGLGSESLNKGEARAIAALGQEQLLLRCRSWLCSLPLSEVIETMRVLPLQPVAGAPPFVRGLSLVRGELVPVVELAALLGTGGPRGARLVIVKAGPDGGRRLALEVDEVLRVVKLALGSEAGVAPLLSAALPAQVAALAALDGAALAVLSSASLLSEETWAALAPRSGW